MKTWLRPAITIAASGLVALAIVGAVLAFGGGDHDHMYGNMPGHMGMMSGPGPTGMMQAPPYTGVDAMQAMMSQWLDKDALDQMLARMQEYQSACQAGTCSFDQMRAMMSGWLDKDALDQMIARMQEYQSACQAGTCSFDQMQSMMQSVMGSGWPAMHDLHHR